MSGFRKRFQTRFVLSALMLLSLLTVVGCYGDAVSVTGTVTLNGAPVNGGTIYFTVAPGQDDSGVVSSATIGSDGTYSITNLRTGYPYNITLTNPQAPQSGEIAARYATFCGLTYSPPGGVGDVCDVQLTP
jgi:hypothetical protein